MLACLSHVCGASNAGRSCKYCSVKEIPTATPPVPAAGTAEDSNISAKI